MRRGLIVYAAAALVLFAAGSASAGAYGSLRYAGTFNLKEFALGVQAGSFGGEVAVGYSKTTIEDLALFEALGILQDGSINPEVSVMSVGGAMFLQVLGNEDYGFDVGARGQYYSFSVETEFPEVRDETVKTTFSGWAAGPVLRGRWYLVEDSFSLGPEIYLKYSSFSSDVEAYGESEEGPSTTTLELEYSMRADFYF